MPGIADFFASRPTNTQRADAIRQSNRANSIADLVQPVKERAVQIQANEQEQKETFRQLAQLDTAIGDDFESLTPEQQTQRYQAAVQSLGQVGIDVSDAPPQLTPEHLRVVRAAGQRVSPEEKVRFGRVFAGQDDQGNPVFAQARTSGGFEVLDGITPPENIQKLKFEDQQRKEQEKKRTDLNKLSSAANVFAEALSSPEAENATGVRGIVLGNIGRLFGTEAGKAKARIERGARRLVAGLAKSLGANPTDADLRLLRETIPTASDDIEVWLDWYENDFIPDAQDAADARGVEVELPDPAQLFGQRRQGQQQADANQTSTPSEQPAQEVPNQQRQQADELLREFGVL